MTFKYKVLIAECGNSLAKYLSDILANNQFKVLTADDEETLRIFLTTCNPDIVLVNTNKPNSRSRNAVRFIRETSAVPVIVIASQSEEKDIIDALDLGADNFVNEQIGAGEFLAKTLAVIKCFKRSSVKSGSICAGRFVAKSFVVDFDTRSVVVDGKNKCLTNSEFKIVALLSKFSGKVLTYNFIVKNVWGPNVAMDNTMLRGYVASIRKKIGEKPSK
ncbi:MAG: response regulator transcription factor, partial [Oscillospiraceae bacterium]